MDFTNQAKETYTIRRPAISLTIWIMSGVCVAGLLSLFIAALTAFDRVMPIPQAVFAALLIEAALVVEAMAFVLRNNRIALIGLIISLAVSGTYNYIQVAHAGALIGITSGWYLLALALGPLAALLSLSLALGDEIRKHESLVNEWEVQRQEYVQQEVKRLVTNDKRRSSRRSKTRSNMPPKTVQLNGKVKIDKKRLPSTILNIYKGKPDASYSDIVQETGWSKGTISSQVNKLIERGYIDRNERGEVVLNGVNK